MNKSTKQKHDQDNSQHTKSAAPFVDEPLASVDMDEETAPLDEMQEKGASSLETAVLDPRPEIENSLLGLSQLAKSETKEPTMRVAKRCHMGAVRDRNEDSCLVFTSETGGHFPLLPFGLYIVADGMGGHKNGHIASKLASRTAARHIIEKIYLPLLNVEGVPTSTPIQEVLQEAVELAHKAVYDPTEETDSGTTLTIALVLGRRLYAAHVGDTRIYLLSGDKLEVVTTDHSLVQRLQDVGQLTAEEAPFYEYRHVLLRAVGQGEEIAVDTYTRLLPKKGKLLLCTDGLCGLVADFEIAMILQQDHTVTELSDELFEAAMEAGGYDNITTIVVEFNL
ncbi:MAG: serine/threonine-protein phosphatase [Anaerolinea sp.]|nr:serine/threonine-protein phosphatase [Anaerolinea sp.]